MTADDARSFILEHDLAEHVAATVDDAPPLPERVVDLLARPTVEPIAP